jgi:hypothetical protein
MLAGVPALQFGLDGVWDVCDYAFCTTQASLPTRQNPQL